MVLVCTKRFTFAASAASIMFAVPSTFTRSKVPSSGSHCSGSPAA